MPLDSSVLRSRQRLAYNGAAAVTLVIGGDGLFQGRPMISAPGVLDEELEDDKLSVVVEALTDALRRLPAADRRDDEVVKEAARLAVRRAFSRMLGKKPVTKVHVVRLH
jgi:ribonuclease J